MNILSIGDTFHTNDNKFIATVHSINNFVDQPNETTSYYVMLLASTTNHCNDLLVAYSPSGKAIADEDFDDLSDFSDFSDLNIDISSIL
jgi:hypothetical protein